MGKGFTYKCPKCGFRDQYITGTEAATERKYILAGICPKAHNALVAHSEAAMSVERALYQCVVYGEIESRLAVKVSAPVRVPIHQHCGCGKTMRRISAEMFCPARQEALKETNVVGAVLWD